MINRALRPHVATFALLFSFGLFVAADADAPAAPSPDPVGFTVHEWGTFTSIAGADGQAVRWMPLEGRDDLPCFVNRIPFGPKWTLSGTVRMETPVLYFYSPADVTVDVGVRFNQGVITEWFPQATVRPAQLPETGAEHAKPLRDYTGTASWTRVRVRPGATPTFPRENSQSHYYPARETDAAPVQVGDALDRFLFYRGVGEFAPPVNVVVEPNDRLVVRAVSSAPLGDVVAFENRGGRIRYLVRRVDGTDTTIDSAQLQTGSVASLGRELERVLIAQGLYPKEARAMIDTWRDTWFEEGSRLLYLAPRSAVDAVLPLTITPQPRAVARVFVGRIELMTRETLADVKRALVGIDRDAFARHGRFLQPFMDRVYADSSVSERPSLEAGRQVVYRNWAPPLSACQ
jgi:hypothetical protein